MSELAERLESVRSAVGDAARQAGRDAADITTIVVTKFHPASVVRQLVELGVEDIGENRHQDAAPKAAELEGWDIRWHFVGQLQRKKARQVRAYASVIHSIDRESLVDALTAGDSGNAGVSGGGLSGDDRLECFIQVNLTDDPGRGGVAPAGLDPLVDRVLGTTGLELLGLMAVAPLGEEPRGAFSRLRTLSDRVRASEPTADKLSIGMSGDFREAILEGATHLRIGTAITGIRPERG